MLLLTKLDKTRVLVTPETIKYIEETPDTLIRFLNGESVIVRESLEEISRLTDEMRRRIQDGYHSAAKSRDKDASIGPQ